jgi:hypothetical protein
VFVSCICIRDVFLAVIEIRAIPMKAGRLATLVLASTVTLILGCGGPGVDMYKVSGKVTVAGQPIQDITVTFMPAAGRPASGITDSSGNFTLATFSPGDGAVGGKHKVSFAYRPYKATDGSGGKPANIPDSSMSKPGAGGAGATTPGAPATPFNAKYTNPETSGIEVEIGSGKPSTFTWDLEK